MNSKFEVNSEVEVSFPGELNKFKTLVEEVKFYVPLMTYQYKIKGYYGWVNEDCLSVPVSTFASERAKTLDNSTRYGKDILDNFDVDTDLVCWPIDNEFDQLVSFEHPEVIGRCPVSGYPDTYKCKVSFVTDKLTMELKAFKLWLNSYYSKQISHEYLGQEIFSVFWKKTQPKYLKVELFPAPRGNVTTVVTCEKYDENKKINGVINAN